ncbi:unnamed protein product [Bursaphelenchus okinawaensis]|uniref:Uncharacterized protein n=1 Tax=Bursaphelenchus okinawaensis TaxID=465554 RepID=A0A811KUM0_9BILA|nr:unnamed protein product [Bursaphelenchus okinawaensis]CAG9112355.1 unnamed protein product [Bursaphelenchus okinawaensis]
MPIKHIILVYLITLASVRTVQSAPDSVYYYRDPPSAVLNPLSRFFYMDEPRHMSPAKRDKKYDRNCFFSPVQCMLSYNTNNNDALYHPRGRK